jgi:transposase-like protein
MIEAVRRFEEPQVAHDYFVAIRWPQGVACPRACGSLDIKYYPKHRRWYCRDCRGQFTAKVGTIFEDSPIGFDKWLPAMWLIASNRNGISSCEVARALKVTQKTAWFMLHRLREVMANESFELLKANAVEADETFIGGRRKMGRFPDGRAQRRAPGYGKMTVQGMVERKGRIRAFVVLESDKLTLADRIRQHVARGTTIYTDAAAAYMGLKRDFTHYAINHAIEYVNGHIHTNSIEAFWSVFKRTIRGTYIAPRPKHLQRYV